MKHPVASIFSCYSIAADSGYMFDSPELDIKINEFHVHFEYKSVWVSRFGSLLVSITSI